MLVLSRKTSESIQIADSIEVTVLEVQGNRVRLGISAPANIVIRRSELLDALQRIRRPDQIHPRVKRCELDAFRRTVQDRKAFNRLTGHVADSSLPASVMDGVAKRLAELVGGSRGGR